MRFVALLAAALLAAALLVACSPSQPSFQNTDITGAEFGRELKLADHNGKPRTLDDFKGKVVALFFGFTHCPDVCPTTLATLREVKEKLGPDGDKLQVVFVTVDPERDTPELLAKYVTAFDPAFIGLSGSPEAIAQTAKAFKVYYQKVPGKTPDTYTMDHTASTYVYDPQGRLRLFVRHGQAVDPIVADVKALLAGK
jgi:protein SCO1/2